METTIHVTEERHQAYISAANHARHQEMESVRREAHNALHEAHNALHEQASRHAWEAQADVARNTRLRELELAFELQRNDLWYLA